MEIWDHTNMDTINKQSFMNAKTIIFERTNRNANNNQ